MASFRSADCRLSRAEYLHPIHAGISQTGVGIFRDIDVPCTDVPAFLAVMPLRDRKTQEVYVLRLNNVLEYRTGRNSFWFQGDNGSSPGSLRWEEPAGGSKVHPQSERDRSCIAQAVCEYARSRIIDDIFKQQGPLDLPCHSSNVEFPMDSISNPDKLTRIFELLNKRAKVCSLSDPRGGRRRHVGAWPWSHLGNLSLSVGQPTVRSQHEYKSSAGSGSAVPMRASQNK